MHILMLLATSITRSLYLIGTFENNTLSVRREWKLQIFVRFHKSDRQLETNIKKWLSFNKYDEELLKSGRTMRRKK